MFSQSLLCIDGMEFEFESNARRVVPYCIIDRRECTRTYGVRLRRSLRFFPSLVSGCTARRQYITRRYSVYQILLRIIKQ